MRIGLVKEIKPAERRVALTDAGVTALVADGHDVLVVAGAGTGAGIIDADYEHAGAKIVDVKEAWATDLVVKVKEPVASEYGHLREETTLFTYLHLAADEALTQALLDARVTAIAYETVEDGRGGLPLLTPMSEVAGRLAAHAAGQYLMGAALLKGRPQALESRDPGD
jgi:alanine dehydrogenase